MDKLSRLAVAGSLTWLVLAIGLILGSHGSTVAAARALEAGSNQPAGPWSAMPVMNTDCPQDLTTSPSL